MPVDVLAGAFQDANGAAIAVKSAILNFNGLASDQACQGLPCPLAKRLFLFRRVNAGKSDFHLRVAVFQASDSVAIGNIHHLALPGMARGENQAKEEGEK